MGVPVLVVEDDVDILATLRMALTDEGYEVSEARNGEEALKLLRASQKPCVVLLDYLLPVLDAAGVMRQVAGDGSLKRHAYVCITARSRLPDPEVEQLFAALQVPVLYKPFELDELLGAVADAASRLLPG